MYAHPMIFPLFFHRSASDSSHGLKSTTGFSQSTSNVADDPFLVFGSTKPPGSSTQGAFTDPLEEIDKLHKSGSMKSDAPTARGGVFDDLDPLNGFSKSTRPFSSENGNRGKDGSPSRSGTNMSAQAPATREQAGKSSSRYSESHPQRKVPDDNFQESPLFDVPTTDSQRSARQTAFSPPHSSANINETNTQAGMSPKSEEQVQPLEDIWLTVSEIPLFTQPTRAPPPSRPPPGIPRPNLKSEAGFFSSYARKKSDDVTSPSGHSSYAQSPRPGNSQIDELEDFAMGRTPDTFEESNIHPSEDLNASSVAAASAAAMKEAMDRAEAKFRHAKEVREREYAKAAKSKEAGHAERDEQATQDAQEREFRENRERLERQQRLREEEEREQRRVERERERAREIEREKARQAVERATREARERAAVEARERAAAEARLKSERAAVEKVHAEARERAERAAVQRAQAEARERAAAEARDRAEKAAADARERANAEAREKEKAAVERAAADARRRAERAAVDRAAAEARERAAAEARERAAAAARSNQQKNDNDLESFFSMGNRPSSAPRPRASSSVSSSRFFILLNCYSPSLIRRFYIPPCAPSFSC